MWCFIESSDAFSSSSYVELFLNLYRYLYCTFYHISCYGYLSLYWRISKFLHPGLLISCNLLSYINNYNSPKVLIHNFKCSFFSIYISKPALLYSVICWLSFKIAYAFIPSSCIIFIINLFAFKKKSLSTKHSYTMEFHNKFYIFNNWIIFIKICLLNLFVSLSSIFVGNNINNFAILFSSMLFILHKKSRSKK